MPILSSIVFDNTGAPYDVNRILTKEFLFDADAYKEYSRVFLPATYVLSYCLQFAALPALIVHTTCWYGKDIASQFRQGWSEVTRPYKRKKRRASRSPFLSSPTMTRSSLRGSLDGSLGASDFFDESTHDSLDPLGHEDVPYIWYLFTGFTMTVIGIYIVEA